MSYKGLDGRKRPYTSKWFKDSRDTKIDDNAEVLTTVVEDVEDMVTIQEGLQTDLSALETRVDVLETPGSTGSFKFVVDGSYLKLQVKVGTSPDVWETVGLFQSVNDIV